MTKMIFMNLPVTDLERSTAFYKAAGAEQDMAFSGDSASCFKFSDEIRFMLLTHERYRDFTTKQIADARTSSQVLLCLFVEDRAEVDAMVERAGAAGAVLDPSPIDDYPFMYGRSFEDPDGHMWGVSWMDVAAATAAQPQAA